MGSDAGALSKAAEMSALDSGVPGMTLTAGLGGMDAGRRTRAVMV